MTQTVSIVIPTQRRPGPLALALGSALAQRSVAKVEVVVVDNDAVPSAQAQVAAMAAGATFPVVYVHEPRPGVAHARNTALAAAKGDFIAFLDDDEEAPEGWLAALLSAQKAYGADAVFGPVKARAPQGLAHHGYLEAFFSRLGPDKAGLIDRYYGCGASLVRRAAMPGDAPFALERNHIGGEDDLLFGRMQQARATFAWAPDAFVWEDPAPERLSLRYALSRAFAYGQGPTEHSAKSGDALGVARWMLIGLLQGAAFGALAAFQWLVRAPTRVQTLDRAVRGLGKTFWGGPFKIAFYGLPARTAR